MSKLRICDEMSSCAGPMDESILAAAAGRSLNLEFELCRAAAAARQKAQAMVLHSGGGAVVPKVRCRRKCRGTRYVHRVLVSCFTLTSFGSSSPPVV